MVEMELVSETMDFVIHLKQLSSREVFIKILCRENFRDINSAGTHCKLHMGCNVVVGRVA
jgi:hypothetical protein